MSNRVKRAAPTRATRRQQQAAASRTRLFAGLGALAVLIVAIVVIAVVATGGDDSDDTAGEISFNGTALPAYDDGPDQAVGLKAPIFVTSDLATGERTVVGGGGGPNDKAKIILFAAHWCPNCQRELPEVAAWLDEQGLPDDVEIVAVSTFPDPQRDNYPPADWFASVDWPYPVMTDDSSGSIATMYGMGAVPAWVVLDNQNFVLARTTGVLGDAGLEQLVDLAAA